MDRVKEITRNHDIRGQYFRWKNYGMKYYFQSWNPRSRDHAYYKAKRWGLLAKDERLRMELDPFLNLEEYSNYCLEV